VTFKRCRALEFERYKRCPKCLPKCCNAWWVKWSWDLEKSQWHRQQSCRTIYRTQIDCYWTYFCTRHHWYGASQAILCGMVENWLFNCGLRWLTSTVVVKIRYANFDTETKQCK
jgi:hypothetical protein